MKISVVIPTYKRPQLLDRLLTSISKQTRRPDEVIVVDDCSMMDEDYLKIISSHKESLNSIVYIKQKENRGAPAARNTGISMAAGDWIALVDDDDEWLPQKLEKQEELIKNSKVQNLGFVYTWTIAKGANGLETYKSCVTVTGNSKRELLTTNYIMSCSVLVKREALLKVGGFRHDMPSCQDWDMWIRIALNEYGFDVVQEVLAIYHRHGGESIGLSPRAMLGYKMLLESHWRPIVKYTSPINWLKKLILYIKACIEVNTNERR